MKPSETPIEVPRPAARSRSLAAHRRPLLALAAVLIAAIAVGTWAVVAHTQAAERTGPRHTNHLAGEASPYLLQHAHNPVDWYPWGPEALKKAKEENKPIFLSVGYSACHWCHVMERESFEQEDVAAILNADFVSIKVDREERPDIDEIYMAAVQMMTGSGGWPMSVFLTPELKPFYGGTYYPREALKQVATELAKAWRERRPEVEKVAENAAAAIRSLAASPPGAGAVEPALIRSGVTRLEDGFDPVNGGFGTAPKFPPAMRLALMLREYRRSRDAKLLRMVTVTLDHMARGGVYDQVGGGFHRYSTDAKWRVPHFEKMLYDNALLVPVYLGAYQLTKDPFYARIARETLDFVLREMTDPHGGFYSTLDADSAGQEGKFYLWTPREVAAVLGPKDAALFDRIYGITAAGNFESKSIPHLEKPVEAWARELKTGAAELWRRMDGMRAKLRAAREKRARPGRDDKILTSWNGLMIRALARGYALLGDERYRTAAESAARFLLVNTPRDGRLLRVSRAGRSSRDAYLDDYSFFSVALLDLYDATRDAQWLREARQLVAAMNARFWDEKQGGYYSTAAGAETLLVRMKSDEDEAIPSGSSMAVLALVRLGRQTGDAELLAKARRLLGAKAPAMRQSPAAYPTFLLAADSYLSTAATAIAAMPGESAKLKAQGFAERAAVKPGQKLRVALQLTVAQGWHVNSNKPHDKYLIPTTVSLVGSAWKVTRILYPPGKDAKFAFSDKPLSVYQGTVLVGVEVAAPAKPAPLTFQVRYQPCNDKQCQAPAEATASVSVKVDPKASGAPQHPEVFKKIKF